MVALEIHLVEIHLVEIHSFEIFSFEISSIEIFSFEIFSAENVRLKIKPNSPWSCYWKTQIGLQTLSEIKLMKTKLDQIFVIYLRI